MSLFDHLWEPAGLDGLIHRYPPGWKEHFLLTLTDVGVTLALPPNGRQSLFHRCAQAMQAWTGSYPDPTLLVYLTALRRRRPEAYARYRQDRRLPDSPLFNINAETFPLTVAVNEMFTISANPMRMRDRLYEADELLDAFHFKHQLRFILPFDGRTTEEIYQLTGHPEAIMAAVEAIAPLEE